MMANRWQLADSLQHWKKEEAVDGASPCKRSPRFPHTIIDKREVVKTYILILRNM